MRSKLMIGPDNIRQLKSAIERAAIRTPEDQWITPDVLFEQEDTDIFQGTFDEQDGAIREKDYTKRAGAEGHYYTSCEDVTYGAVKAE